MKVQARAGILSATLQPEPKSFEQAILRRARDLAGGVSFLSMRLHVSATELDAMLHGHEPVPSWLVLRVIDFINAAETRRGVPSGLPDSGREQAETKH